MSSMGSCSAIKLIMFIFLLQLLTLPMIITSKSNFGQASWNKIDTICPSQSCKQEENWNSTRWCSCDRRCVKFRDCCFDAITESLEEELESRFQETKAECTRTASLGFSMLVSTCSNYTNYVTEDNRLLCSKVPTNAAKSHMLDIPVTSSLTGFTYSNVHCALCNGDARHLLPRKAVLKMDPHRGSPADNPSDWIYEHGSLSWKHSLRNKPNEQERQPIGEEDPNGFGLFRRKEMASVNRKENSEIMEESSDTLLVKEMKTVLSFQNLSVWFTDESPEVLEDMSDGNSQIMVSKDRILIQMEADIGRQYDFTTETGDEKETMGERERSKNIINLEYDSKTRLFLDDEHIKRCPLSSMITNCDREKVENDGDLAIKCASYLMPIYTLQEAMIFRNPHCALCNNVAIADLKCLSKPLKEKKVDVKEKSEGFIQLEFLFGDVLTGDKRCGSRFIWDPLLRRCYSIDDGNGVDSHESRKIEEDMATNKHNNVPTTEESKGDDYCENSTLLTLSKVQWYLASAFFGVSIVCLGLYVLIHICSRRPSESTLNNAEKLQSHPNPSEKMYITDRSFHILAWLLVLGQILFIAGSRRSEIRTVCVAIAVAHNFLSLAAISWFSVFCLRVFQSFFSVKSLKSINATEPKSEVPSMKLSFIAWTIPTIFSILCLTLELLPGTLRTCLARGGACWYGDAVSFKIFFVLPALLMLAGDGCIFTAIIFGIREKRGGTRGKNNSNISRRRSSTIAYNDRRKFRLCARLGLLIMISWNCAAAASLGGLTSLWYGFVIFSGLQGVFVFVSSGAKSKVTHIIWVRATGKPLTPEAENRNKKKNARSDISETPTVSVQK